MIDLDQFDDVVVRLRAGYAPAEFRAGAQAPRRRRRRAGAALPLALGLAVGAAVLLADVTTPPLGGRALAWSATPTALIGDERAAVESVCRASLAAATATVGPVENAEPGAPVEVPLAAPADAGDLVLVDGREDYALALFESAGEDPPTENGCMLARNDAGWTVFGMVSGPAARPSREIQAVTVRAGSRPGGQQAFAFAVAFGNVEPSVVDLVVDAGDGAVHATVHEGRFVAFWPATARDAVARALDADGNVVWRGEVLPDLDRELGAHG